MRVLSGKVIDGKIVVEGETLEEGSTVTVLERAGEQGFRLNEEQEEALVQAIGEVDRGDVINADDFFQQLRNRR